MFPELDPASSELRIQRLTIASARDQSFWLTGPYPRILDTGCDYAAGCSVVVTPAVS